jgi:hypothetical protein
MGAVVFLGSMVGLGCQPGSLPCDKDNEWKAICASDGGGGVTSTGGSGGGNTGGSSGSGGGTSSGGTGGSGGGMDAGSGGGGGGSVSESTAVPGCDAFKTVGEMESKFFAMRCGKGAACHEGATAAFGDLKTTPIYKRLLDTPVKLNCTSPSPAKWIDKGDYMKSLIIAKTTDMPKCPNDTTKGAGLRMPSTPEMVLSDSEATCLKNYLMVITK